MSDPISYNILDNDVEHISELQILIVDDESSDLSYYSAILSGLCTISFATDSATAMSMCVSDNPPDLILCDVLMPDQTGFEFCQELKSQPFTKDIPVIFLSSLNALEDKLEGFSTGGIDYIVKPVPQDEIVQRITTHLNIILQRKKLEFYSYRDAVTKVANRRIYEYVFTKEWQNCIRYEEMFSLIMLDIDKFKSYNTFYGHVAGDEVLMLVAQQLEQFGRRSNDLFARIGGEEFVLLLPTCQSEGASQIAQRMIEAVNMLSIPHSESPSKFLTISAGVATMFPEANIQQGCLFNFADNALFKAKQKGGNQICVSDHTRIPKSFITNGHAARERRTKQQGSTQRVVQRR